MKFSQYLTEASGSVWVLFTDTQSGGANVDVIDNIEIFSVEEKLVSRVLELMPEADDLFGSYGVDQIKTVKAVEKLIKDHEELDIYHQVFMYKKIKID